MAPDMGEGINGDISAVDIQKTARLDDAPVGDETKSGSTKTPPGYCIQTMGFKGDALAFLFGPLSQDPIIMGSTGRF